MMVFLFSYLFESFLWYNQQHLSIGDCAISCYLYNRSCLLFRLVQIVNNENKRRQMFGWNGGFSPILSRGMRPTCWAYSRFREGIEDIKVCALLSNWRDHKWEEFQYSRWFVFFFFFYVSLPRKERAHTCVYTVIRTNREQLNIFDIICIVVSSYSRCCWLHFLLLGVGINMWKW